MDNANSAQEHLLIKDIKPGLEILQFFQLSSMETRKTKTGQDYLNLSLSDRSGSITAKVWSNILKMTKLNFDTGDFVKVKASTQLFGDILQLNIDRIRKAEASELPDMNRLVRKTVFDTDMLYEQILQAVELLDPPELSEFVRKVIETNSYKFKTYPAAKRIHHAYLGGFIEHTYTVTMKVQALIDLIPDIDASLAIAGAILHDIGKLHEIDPDTKGRTVQGRLKGHVMLGIEILRDAANELEITSAPWFSELEHILLSHHGEPEFGALVKPLTKEAILVHFIDNLDSKLKIIEEALEKTDANGFSDYNKYLEGRAFAGSHRLMEE
jgi:3'-5' exoribonuclease